MLKIYYAHCMAIYNTPQEKRDVELLQKLGFEVVNPNEKIHQDAVAELAASGAQEKKMEYFFNLVATCDALAFRSLPDGKIPCGVWGELTSLNIPVIELPSGISRRGLTLNQTREYLKEIGQR